MIKKSLLFFGLFLTSMVFGQLNMTFLSNLNFQTAHGANLANIWGYVDEVGNEYAVIGTSEGISIVDVTIPTAPVEVFWEQKTSNIWRELKVFGDYLYVTTEASEGLTIIDMSPLPGSTTLPVVQYFGPSGQEWQSSHTIYMDDDGYAYISGANRGNGGIIILDVFTNPMAPIEVGVFDNWYSHDCYARNDTLFGAHISDGFFSIVDISDKANPILLATKATPNFFTHNIWLSDDGTFVLTTDEKPSSYVAAYDITSVSNIVETDRIQTSPGSGVIPHNTHILGDFAVTSYYRDGVTIHDITRPNNLVEVGKFDTSPLTGNGFNGCWGVYPYLPSGNIIASDMEGGLFVLGASYVKGCYVEGIVTDSITNLPLQGVTVTILNEIQTDLSKANGSYAVSTVSTGLKTVKFNKTGYYPKTYSFNLATGQLINQNVELVPIPPYPFTIKVIDQATNAPINNVKVRLESPNISHEGQTNGLGEEDFTLYYQDNYYVTVGKWGYVTDCQTTLINNSTGLITVSIAKGIYDDFSFDFGWNTNGNATTGLWERAIPIGGSGSANAEIDADYDCGAYAFVSGNANTLDADEDDVDGGNIVLISPSFNLSTYSDPYINYARYFFNNFGPYAMDDTLKIILSNGTTTALIDKVGRDTANFHKWVFKSIRVQDFLTPTATMTLIVRTSDLDTNVNITEAGFDFFSVSNSPLLELENEIGKAEFTLFPNPANDKISISGVKINEKFYVYDAKGQEMYSFLPQQSSCVVDLSRFSEGLYIVQQGNIRKKFIKN
jgi:choice-of-anchor B domain-containing protein